MLLSRAERQSRRGGRGGKAADDPAAPRTRAGLGGRSETGAERGGGVKQGRQREVSLGQCGGERQAEDASLCRLGEDAEVFVVGGKAE